MPVCDSGGVVASWLLLIRGRQRARCQAEIPLIALSKLWSQLQMPVNRKAGLHRTYFTKKMLTYYEANRQQRHVHDLGLQNFRVLTVTSTPERVGKMLSALRTITDGRGSNMFLFADETMLASSNPLD